MFKIDGKYAETSLPAPYAVGVQPNGYFRKGDEDTNVIATGLDFDFLNAIQEEIAYVLEAGEINPSKTNRQQLYDAITNIIYDAYGGGPIDSPLTEDLNLVRIISSTEDVIKFETEAGSGLNLQPTFATTSNFIYDGKMVGVDNEIGFETYLDEDSFVFKAGDSSFRVYDNKFTINDTAGVGRFVPVSEFDLYGPVGPSLGVDFIYSQAALLKQGKITRKKKIYITMYADTSIAPSETQYFSFGTTSPIYSDADAYKVAASFPGFYDDGDNWHTSIYTINRLFVATDVAFYGQVEFLSINPMTNLPTATATAVTVGDIGDLKSYVVGNPSGGFIGSGDYPIPNRFVAKVVNGSSSGVTITRIMIMQEATIYNYAFY